MAVVWGVFVLCSDDDVAAEAPCQPRGGGPTPGGARAGRGRCVGGAVGIDGDAGGAGDFFVHGHAGADDAVCNPGVGGCRGGGGMDVCADAAADGDIAGGGVGGGGGGLHASAGGVVDDGF